MAACSLTIARMGSQLYARDGAGLLESGTGKADGRAPHVVTLWGTGPLGTAGQARELLLLAVPGGQSPHMGRDPGGNHRVNTSGCRGWGQKARRPPSLGGFNLEMWERAWTGCWAWAGHFHSPSHSGSGSQGQPRSYRVEAGWARPQSLPGPGLHLFLSYASCWAPPGLARVHCVSPGWLGVSSLLGGRSDYLLKLPWGHKGREYF